MMRATAITIGTAAVVALAADAPSIFNSQESPDGCGGVTLLIEDFDGVTPPALPDGWVATNAIDPDGIFWITSNSGDPFPPADSPPNAAFVNDPSAISDKRLDSPLIDESQATECATVTFRNNFSLQDGFDGGVLEVSFDEGLTFQDVVAAGGTFTAGGYTGTISGCCGNPLAGRQAWTGNSGGFIATTLELPIKLRGHRLLLRWRMGSDTNGSDQGWRIDSVFVSQPHKPTPPPPTPTPTATPPLRPTPTPRSRPTAPPRPTPR
jgi:hypothetical protein